PPTPFDARAARVKARLADALRRPLAGTVNSQGDRTHRADDVRTTYGYSGLGVRIGVISDSFNALGAASADVASGNLPGPGNPFGRTTPVTVIEEDPTGSDEGRAMLQIVHDLAPDAQLFFATADTSEAGFASNIVALRNAPYNCDIIIDDVFYFDEPVFQDGIVAQAVNTVTAAGALYFSAAGNEGSVAKGTSGYFEGDFNDTGSPVFTFPGGAKSGTIHNFGGANGDIITTAGPFAYTLNWSDPATASANDYDLFLVSSTGTVKAASTNIQNGAQAPFEIFGPPSFAAGDRLVVFKTAAAAVRAFALNTLRGRLTVTTTGQTHGHSSAVNAFSVAAAPAPAPGPYPAAFSGTSPAENFTADGPRRVFYDPAGVPITPGNVLFGTNGGTVRSKPDITAADGVSTTLPGTSGLNPFYGTSAAAPHAGAIAGLLKSANPALTPAQIRTILTTTAVDIESAGYDNITGFGIVQAFQAMQAVAPTPHSDVALGTTTFAEGTFSNGNGGVDPGELATLVVQLTNPTATAATAVQATLTTSTPGVTITQGSASYGTLAPSASATNGATPFGFGVSSSVPCSSVITFTLTVSFGGGSSPRVYSVSMTVGKFPAPLAGTLGSAPPTGTGFTSTSGQQTGRLTRNGVGATCAAAKSNPGLTAVTGARQFDAYTFTNTASVSQCVTVTLSAANGLALYTAAYTSAGFVPANPSTNFLADPGLSGTLQTYSFNVAPATAFTVVVHDINVTPASGSPYTLTVALATCASGPACTPVTITTPSIASGTINVPYTQSFAATGGSGAVTWSISGALPTGVTLTGNTLSGTPTQGGSFPISVTATDAAGCTPDTNPYTLSIAGGCPPPPPALVVTAPAFVGQGSPNRVASIAPIVGATYVWGITNGTITGGQGTPQVTFTAGTAGTPLTLTVNATIGVCPAGGGFANVTVLPIGSSVQFYTVTPCRIVDTRKPIGPVGGPALASGGPDRAFALAGACGIPAGASSVSANVTVTDPAAPGNLVIYRGDGVLPGTSTINFGVGQTRANNAQLQLALDGSGTVKVSNASAGPVHFILDVNGYFQ
ncbi:MAG TPA: S8 family serine peptidase, partial [Thermoanaerobaculia bacterium]|nr:S8 family serine peptidase [Thermoanaerobaculia bacterium]